MNDLSVAANVVHSFNETTEPGFAPLRAGVATTSLSSETQPRPRFNYMFKNPRSASLPPSDASLIALGRAMQDGPDLGDHPTLPAGYIFLAQFIAHDISFDINAGQDVSPGPIDATTLVQGRTYPLELESIYGLGGPAAREELYEADHIRLRVGLTAGNGRDESRVYRNDLPRFEAGDPNQRQAITGDPRNDENLGLAQTHVAFLRFHNCVVERLSNDGVSEETLFEKAQEKVVQHYQWMVLKDFLPKVIEEAALETALRQARENQPGHFGWQSPADVFVPVEFSAAAFRLGHSLLRGTYEWNRVFQSSSQGGSRAAIFSDLFSFTGFASFGSILGAGAFHLPTDWVIDWTRFIDFTGFNGIANNPKFNRSKRIDTTLDPVMKQMQSLLDHITNLDFRSLSVLDLIRGSRLGLPCGQDAARAIKLQPLSPSEVAREPHRDKLLPQLHLTTPLWYYLLKEAQLFHCGERLGPLGSYIVAQTIVAFIRMSRFSILKESNWQPGLGQINRSQFGMADLLVLADVVNPLGS